MKQRRIFLFFPPVALVLIFSFAFPRDSGKVILTIQGKGEMKGMVCEGCKRTVERVLKEVEGVSRVEVDLKQQEARVEFDPEKTGVDDLIRAVEETKMFTAREKKDAERKN